MEWEHHQEFGQWILNDHDERMMRNDRQLQLIELIRAECQLQRLYIMDSHALEALIKRPERRQILFKATGLDDKKLMDAGTTLCAFVHHPEAIHWTLIAVNEGSAHSYDSLRGENGLPRPETERAIRTLQRACKWSTKTPIVYEKVPLQSDFWECGYYCVACILEMLHHGNTLSASEWLKTKNNYLHAMKAGGRRSLFFDEIRRRFLLWYDTELTQRVKRTYYT